MAGEWPVTTLEKAPLEIIDGDRGTKYPVQTEFFPTGHCLFLNAGNVTAAGFKFADCAFITAEKDASLRKGKLIRNDVVLTTRGTVGNAAYFDNSVPFDHIRINSGMVILRAQSAILLPRYVYLFVRSALFHKQVSALRTGSAQPQLPIRDINRIEIPIPPLREQRAIAHILGTLDDKIELNRRVNATLEGMARALFKSWFVDFDPVRAKAEGRDTGLPADLAALFPDRLVESELGEIPEGWEVGRIADLADVVGGSTPSTKESAYWDEGTYYWATPKDLSALTVPVLLDTERRITGKGLSQISSGLLPAGTVLLSSRAPIGYLAIAEVPTAINQGFIAMRPATDISNLFLWLWAASAHEEIISRANGSTFLEISKANFRPIPVVKPTKLVMAAFERQARPLYEHIVVNERESRTLAALRDALLPQLLSGEVRVPDVSDLNGIPYD
jgi:type I restriction enzyme, S subunit